MVPQPKLPRRSLLMLPWLACPPGLRAAEAPSSAFPLLGRRVRTTDGVELGRVVDVLVDADGRPVAVVADVGGFLGIGLRRVALHWSMLNFRAHEDGLRISVQVPPDVVISAPAHDPNDPATILQRQ